MVTTLRPVATDSIRKVLHGFKSRLTDGMQTDQGGVWTAPGGVQIAFSMTPNDTGTQ